MKRFFSRNWSNNLFGKTWRCDFGQKGWLAKAIKIFAIQHGLVQVQISSETKKPASLSISAKLLILFKSCHDSSKISCITWAGQVTPQKGEIDKKKLYEHTRLKWNKIMGIGKWSVLRLNKKMNNSPSRRSIHLFDGVMCDWGPTIIFGWFPMQNTRVFKYFIYFDFLWRIRSI